MTFAMHAGIAFYTFHARIACLVSLLHAGIVCLAFMACDWLFLIGAYPGVSVVSLAMISCYNLHCDGMLTLSLLNMTEHIPPTVLGLLEAGIWHKMAVLECTKIIYLLHIINNKALYVHMFYKTIRLIL